MPLQTDIGALRNEIRSQTQTIPAGQSRTYTFTFDNAIIISVPVLSWSPTTNISEQNRSYTRNTVTITLSNGGTTERTVTVTCDVYLIKGS